MISNQKTLWYRSLRTIMYIATRLFYKHIAVKYLEPLPRDKPIIFVGNHLSTFIDPILISVNTGLYPAFMTRSDVFKHPLVRRFLFSIRMLPIYRRRDGKDSVQRNAEVFDVAIQQLEANLQFVIFGEGSHSSIRRLRELKKGFARIGFEALERNNGELDVQIVPVGVEYSDFQKMYQTVTQTYGEPIPLRKYYPAYQQHPKLTLNAIRDDVSRALQKLIIHIPTEEHYEAVEGLRQIARPWLYEYLNVDQSDPHQRMAAEQQMINAQTAFEAADPERMRQLSKLILSYQQVLDKNNIRPYLVQGPYDSALFLLGWLLLLILFSPLHLLGVLTSYIPYKLPVWLSENSFKDFMYYPAVNMTVGLLLFPLFWLLETVVVHAIWGNAWLSLAFAVIMPFSAWFALHYWIWLKKWWGRWRFWRFTRKKSAEWAGLKQQYEEIIAKTQTMIEAAQANKA